MGMSLQDANFSIEDNRIRRVAEILIAQEMQFVREELEMLRADLNKSYEVQRHGLQEFYDDALSIIKSRIEQ
jgi:hypothetical protein